MAIFPGLIVVGVNLILFVPGKTEWCDESWVTPLCCYYTEPGSQTFRLWCAVSQSLC